MKLALWTILIVSVLVCIQFLVLFLKYKNSPPVPAIYQEEQTFGSGEKTLRYIAAGDSTAVGIGASGAQASYPYKVAEYLGQSHRVLYKNIGVSGYLTGNVISQQLEQIIAYNPDVVTISLGANDAVRMKPTQGVVKNYRTIINTLSEKTNATVYLTNTPNFTGGKLLPFWYIKLIEYRSRHLNPILMELEKNNPRIKIIDIHNFGWDTLPNLETTYASDNFHPNDVAYENWTKAFLSRISADYGKTQ